MTSNPLAERRAAGAQSNSSVAGDIRTVADSASGKVIAIHRTSRPYAFDLCDAYNAAMSEDARQRGLEWYVSASGEAKLGDSAAWQSRHTNDLARGAETDRQQHIRAQNRAQPIDNAA